MNKKICIAIGMLLVFGLCICAGGFVPQERKYTIEDLDNLAEIKIYSAQNNGLIKTIKDEEQLYQYNQYSFLDNAGIEGRQDELKKELEGVEEQYYLISYKYPVARFGEKELEENITITLYEDTNIIKMTVAEGNIKAFSLPEEFLVFYDELSEEEMKFYHSLVE